MRSRSLIAPAVTALGALCVAPAAFAQDTARPVEGIGVQPNLSVDPDSLPHIEGTRAPGGWNWNAGAAIQILERPLAGRVGSDRIGLIHWQLWSNYIVQLGLGSRVGVALDFPVMFAQGGDLTPLGRGPTAVAGLGDLRAVFRWTSRPQMSASRPASSDATSSTANATQSADNTFVGEGPGWGVVVSGSVPTGDPQAFTGNGAWILHPTLIGDFRLFGLILAGQVGYRARLNGRWLSQADECAAPGSSDVVGVDCIANVPQRDAITWSIGLRVPRGLLGGFASIYGEMVGSFDARHPGTPNTTPLEMGLGVQRPFGEVTATLGVSSGVTDAPGSPRFRAMFMVQWAPRFVDEDGDGLRDNTGEDQCPGIPEDRDGYQDSDGCPEDNDNDEVPDAEDRCPRVDEDTDGFQDEDGCPDPDNDNDGVLDAQDRCRDVAMGPNPNPEEPGCPNDDLDGDGVQNSEDRCPQEAPGSAPDAARPGCPAPDRDRDTVPDPVDACPDQPAGESARPDQRGCPEPDRDHDGVLNEADRCADTAETLNGFEDEDGCPEATPPRTARARVRVVNASAASPGAIELLEPVRFTATDQLDPTSQPVIAQLALALVATSRVQSRHYVVAVARTPAAVRGPLAIDAARATRRRDAVIAALRARAVPEWVVRPAEIAAPPATAARIDRGVVISVVETPAPAPAATTPAATTPAATTPPAVTP